MKKLLILFAALGILLGGCTKGYDDSAIWSSINSLESRMSALKTVMDAYEKNLFVTAVTPGKDGYTISFSDGSKAEVSNGAKGDKGETVIERITVGSESVSFTLTDGSSFEIPLYGGLEISFDKADLMVMLPVSERDIRYTVTTKAEKVSVQIMSSPDIKAKAVSEQKYSGRINVRTGSEIDEYSKVVIIVSDGLSTIIRSIKFEKEGLEIIDSAVMEVGETGGQVEIAYLTNSSCEIIIPERASWMKVLSTRAMAEHGAVIQVERNYGMARTDTVVVRSENGTELKYIVSQHQNSVIKDPDDIQRNALIALYYATGGDNWVNKENWCSDKPLEEWYGIDTWEGNVIGIQLDDNNLTGRIPEDFSRLEHLSWLFLYGNEVNLPATIGDIKSLTSLTFGQYDKPGELPKSLWNLTNLYYLQIHCKVHGNIPPEIGNLTELRSLYMYNCGLSGRVPDEIGNLIHLEELNLGSNSLSGSLPESMSKLSNLRTLCLTDNLLSGHLPSGFGNMTNLTRLELYNNNFSGPVPESWTSNTSLWSAYWGLVLEGNEFEWEPFTIELRNVTDLDGKEIEFKTEFAKHKYTILFKFYPGSTAGYDALHDLYEKYHDSGLEIIGYSDVSEASIRSFIQDYNIEWRNIVISESNYLMQGEYWPMMSYPYNSYPAITVLNSEGKVVCYDFGSTVTSIKRFVTLAFGDTIPEYYTSTDYSRDGAVTVLQKATKGRGIDIVMVGDAYSDRSFAEGVYDRHMKYALEYLFTEEPYKSFRDHFNVYQVDVVSENDVYEEYSMTALDVYFGEGTLVGGDNSKVIEYALKAIPSERMDEAMLIVLLNTERYCGTCHMFSSTEGDHSGGTTVSYVPAGDISEFRTTLHHEANGHGFAKLDDEYWYDDNLIVTPEDIAATRAMGPYGWWKNIDFTPNPKLVKWSKFLEDPRYANEGLGLFEGGHYCGRGVWRATDTSIMRYNTGGFNAPSREAIYYRIHKLAYGLEWEYDYEEFVKYDEVTWNNKTKAPYAEEPRDNFIPLAKPVKYNHTWLDELNKQTSENQ